jgi:hypothetical protein
VRARSQLVLKTTSVQSLETLEATEASRAFSGVRTSRLSEVRALVNTIKANADAHHSDFCEQLHVGKLLDRSLTKAFQKVEHLLPAILSVYKCELS